MSNEVKVFSNGKIDLPVKEIDGQVYFEAEASAIGLGITQVKNSKVYVQWKRVNNYLNNVSAHVRKEENSQHVGKGSWITEQQFYKLAFKANNAIAEAFQDWVAGEVLPAIRKHGVYMTDQKAYDLVNNKDSLIDLLEQAANQLKQKDIQISEMKPKALFADSVASSETTILIGVLAKIIKQNGIEYLTVEGKPKPMGQNNFFKWLRENGYLISRKGDSWNTPTQKAMDMGLFEVKESTTPNPDGSVRITKTTKVTGKGQQYFINKLLGENAA
ncbi:phage antirepressor KilAC domain-containing protein [Lactobacillus delbrueckii subsp. lactis]|nr:phage antirepressor KilAC domain-containing protein [Lactobacillus delbrueckii subsp. lactis]MCD5603276.1 phage antirepressor KilAC domain-containing protein [Lactobacillus delbrueckii subsp. lactis]